MPAEPSSRPESVRFHPALPPAAANETLAGGGVARGARRGTGGPPVYRGRSLGQAHGRAACATKTLPLTFQGRPLAFLPIRELYFLRSSMASDSSAGVSAGRAGGGSENPSLARRAATSRRRGSPAGHRQGKSDEAVHP